MANITSAAAVGGDDVGRIVTKSSQNAAAITISPAHTHQNIDIMGGERRIEGGNHSFFNIGIMHLVCGLITPDW